MLVQFFVPHALVQRRADMLLDWARIIAGFALALGVGSLFRTHWTKIRRRQREWGYSIVTLVSFFVMLWAGVFYGSGEGSVIDNIFTVEPGNLFEWLFNNIQVPLDSTMFSLLAFFIASAAYRTFRARTLEASLLLITAIVVMLGRVPLGQMMYDRMPEIYEWIMQYPAVAGKRGILFGAALGSIATSLRIILGIERSHIGGGAGT